MRLGLKAMGLRAGESVLAFGETDLVDMPLGWLEICTSRGALRRPGQPQGALARRVKVGNDLPFSSGRSSD